MRKFFYSLLIIILIAACNPADAWDCIKSSGSIQQEEIAVDFFNKLEVRHRIQLIVKQGNQRKVILETGENLRDKISISVKDSTLLMENGYKCNLFRDYGITKIYVTAPNLMEIRNGSGLAVVSEGVLNYGRLDLVSEDVLYEGEIHNVGDFELVVDVDNLNIISNGNSNFFIEGQANQAAIGFYGGNSRFEGADLVIQDLRIFHRSSNDMIVNPQQSITGKLLSEGDVISLNQPADIDVEELWDGRLIFQD